MKSKQKQKQKMKVLFKARPDSGITDKQANSYGMHILRKMKADRVTMVKPDEIVEDAKDVSTPYHNHFEWDNDKAGHEHRLHQARLMIGSIMQVQIIHEEEEPRLVRFFLNVNDGRNRGYMPQALVIRRPELMDKVIAKALKEAKFWKEKYEVYNELGKIKKAITETLQEYDIK